MTHKKLTTALAVLLTCSFLITTYCCLTPYQTPITPKQATVANGIIEPKYNFEPFDDNGPVGYGNMPTQIKTADQISQEAPDWVAEPLNILEPFDDPGDCGYTPAQIKTAYNLPSSGGSGATIAIIGAYHTPNIETYYNTFSDYYGLPKNNTGNFIVHSFTTNTDPNWALEACLDVQWAHAIAPEAKILLIEAVNPGWALVEAVKYAAQLEDVTAISMSWGSPEGSYILDWSNYCLNFSTKVFFAASGDSGQQVLWPACSQYVVSVGGTTLHLDEAGKLNGEEIAWGGSGGGESLYESMPSYQERYNASYELPGKNRCIPDVAYNADPSTGYSVYCGGWHKIGGTSAGAPQWAAIYALDKSANHTNLYQSALTVDPLPFTDITEGSNGLSADVGYDCVTGLGSPNTTNYGLQLTATPTQGPASGAVTLDGLGFTVGSTVDLEYLNPLTFTWTTITSGLANPAGTFNYGTSAIDLQQNSPAGDNPPQHDDIIYRATDNGNGRTVTTPAAYMEMKRGITRVDTAVASGVFGDGSDLTAQVRVGNSESVTLIGKWFKPGSVSLTWDGTENLGSAVVNGLGYFSGSFTVPEDATDGTHTVTVDDGVVSLSFTLSSSSSDPLNLLPVPEGPEIAVFAATLAAAALAVWIKRK